MSGAAAGYQAISTVISNITSMAAAILQFIGSWFIFKKMGLPGWKGIIPFYNVYVLCDMLWEKKQFKKYIILSAVTFGLSIFSMIFMFIAIFAGVYASNSNGSYGLMIAMIVLTVLVFIAMMVVIVFLMIWCFKLYNRLAKAFGKSTGFAVGLLLLSPVFYMILGFDKSVFLGKPIVEEGQSS